MREPIEMPEQAGPGNAIANSDESPKRLLAVRHVARILGVHESTVRMWADSGVLDSYRIGPRQDRRIPHESVIRVLEAARQTMPVPRTASRPSL